MLAVALDRISLVLLKQYLKHTVYILSNSTVKIKKKGKIHMLLLLYMNRFYVVKVIPSIFVNDSTFLFLSLSSAQKKQHIIHIEVVIIIFFSWLVNSFCFMHFSFIQPENASPKWNEIQLYWWLSTLLISLNCFFICFYHFQCNYLYFKAINRLTIKSNRKFVFYVKYHLLTAQQSNFNKITCFKQLNHFNQIKRKKYEEKEIFL